MKENLEQTKKDPTNQYYAYVTRDDLVEVYPDNSVILTIRNYDDYEATNDDYDDEDDAYEEEEDSQEPRTMRIRGRWKTIDVRLVTDDGEALQHDPSVAESIKNEIKEEKERNECLYDIPSYLLGPTSSSQPTESTENTNRRSIRPKRFLRTEIEETNNGSMVNEINEHEERRITARALLGYRPPKKQLKRNLDEVSDSFESR